MPVYKPQSLTKLLKWRCKFGSFLPGSQGKKGNVMNFMVCFFLKEKRCRVFKGKSIFFWHSGLKYISYMDLPVRDIE